MKGSFRITAKEENLITERGVRAFIMERLLNSPFRNASAFNVDEKTVEIRLEGGKTQINAFREKLREAVIAKFGNPGLSFTPFRQNAALEIPGLMRSSQALMVGQLQKGITVQLGILNLQSELLHLQSELLQAVKKLPAELGRTLRGG